MLLVERMILESTLVLVLLVSGELGREDHYELYTNITLIGTQTIPLTVVWWC